MSEKKNVPKIRFPEFTEPWEQRKLRDFGKATGGTSIESEFSKDGVYKVINIGSYSESSVYNDQGIRAIKSDKTSNRVLNKNDLTMILNDKTASGNIIGRVLLIEKSGVYVYNQRTERIEINIDKYDSIFLYEMLNAPNIREKIIKQAQGNTQIYVNWTTIASLDYMIPSRGEQIKIGEYLHSLTNLITLHQRKLDHVKDLKKSMLQKMFPKNGQLYPEVRFPEFTDAWEQRKLEEYLTVSKEKNTYDIYGKTDVLSVSGDYGIVNQIEFQGRSFAGVSVSNYGVVQTGDVVYTKSPLKSNPYGIIKTNKGKPGIVSTLYAIYHPKKNAFPDFIQVYFEQHARMNNYMHPLVNKGAKNDMKVSAENALKGFICFPSYEEQKTISAFFTALDHLITLHQRELDHLKLLKKGMLQQMFV